MADSRVVIGLQVVDLTGLYVSRRDIDDCVRIYSLLDAKLEAFPDLARRGWMRQCQCGAWKLTRLGSREVQLARREMRQSMREYGVLRLRVRLSD